MIASSLPRPGSHDGGKPADALREDVDEDDELELAPRTLVKTAAD